MILGAMGWVLISFFFFSFSVFSFFYFSFNSFKREGIIQLQNIARFYINQILFASTRRNGCFSVWFILRVTLLVFFFLFFYSG